MKAVEIRVKHAPLQRWLPVVLEVQVYGERRNHDSDHGGHASEDEHPRWQVRARALPVSELETHESGDVGKREETT